MMERGASPRATPGCNTAQAGTSRSQRSSSLLFTTDVKMARGDDDNVYAICMEAELVELNPSQKVIHPCHSKALRLLLAR